jgi:hypothetical protein
MTVKYTYTVDEVWSYPEELNGFSSVVSTVTMNATATDSETNKSAQQTRVVSLPVPAKGASFIQFSDLTEAQVIQFAKNSFGVDRIATLEATLDSLLASQQPTLPWA